MDSRPDVVNLAFLEDVQNVTHSTYKSFTIDYLAKNIFRKFIPIDSSLGDASSYETFRVANSECKSWRYSEGDEWEMDRVLTGEIRWQLYHFFTPSSDVCLWDSYASIFSGFRVGPGASVGATGTSLYAKLFGSRLTCTDLSLYTIYRACIHSYPRFDEAESIRYSTVGAPLQVKGSLTTFVPKTSAASRMVCTEPSLNMIFQLGLSTLLEARLKSFFGIDLKRQPLINQDLARRGSIDGSLATIDLSSASDRISIELCRYLLPKWVFDTLMELRSPCTTVNGKTEELYMMSTMGNGFTFPLQTIIFAAISKACQSVYGRPGQKHVVAVFGDDIVCPSWSYQYVIRWLKRFGSVPNMEKTFNEGPFRESCGADWFYGQPVRPVFIKKLDTPQDIVVAINSLNEWSAYTGICLNRTVNALVSILDVHFRNRVPFDENQDAGIRVPLFLANPKYDKNGSFTYKAWIPVPKYYRVHETGIRSPAGRYKELPFNPPGLEISFLFGELKEGRIAARAVLRPYYKPKKRVSPYWDFIPRDRVTNGVRLSWTQWETAVEINLSRPW